MLNFTRIVIVFLIISSRLYAQESNFLNYSLPELSTDISFDGIVEPDEWNGTKPIPMVSHWPMYGEEPNLDSKIYLGYSEDYLYLSAICYVDPADIQEITFERDVINMALDQVAIVLDTYDDNENCLVFSVSPTGSRVDLSVRNDAIGQAPIDVSWNSFWEAKVSKFDGRNKNTIFKSKIPASG